MLPLVAPPVGEQQSSRQTLAVGSDPACDSRDGDGQSCTVEPSAEVLLEFRQAILLFRAERDHEGFYIVPTNAQCLSTAANSWCIRSLCEI